MKYLFVVAVVFYGTTLVAQIPVHFSYGSKKIDEKKYELFIKATIDKDWHVYAQVQPKNFLAQPTKISFVKHPLIKLVGKTKETGKKEWFENKEVDIAAWQYPDSVVFTQIILLSAKVKTSIGASITYQACTDEMCLPPKTEKFFFKIE